VQLTLHELSKRSRENAIGVDLEVERDANDRASEMHHLVAALRATACTVLRLVRGTLSGWQQEHCGR